MTSTYQSESKPQTPRKELHMSGFAACLLAGALLVVSSPQGEVVGAPQATQLIGRQVPAAPLPAIR